MILHPLQPLPFRAFDVVVLVAQRVLIIIGSSFALPDDARFASAKGASRQILQRCLVTQ
jgi:hypothetical protein